MSKISLIVAVCLVALALLIPVQSYDVSLKAHGGVQLKYNYCSPISQFLKLCKPKVTQTVQNNVPYDSSESIEDENEEADNDYIISKKGSRRESNEDLLLRKLIKHGQIYESYVNKYIRMVNNTSEGCDKVFGILESVWIPIFAAYSKLECKK